MRNLILLPLVSLGLVLLQLHLCPDERVVVSAVELESAFRQVDHVGANTVHEILEYWKKKKEIKANIMTFLAGVGSFVPEPQGQISSRLFIYILS